MTLLTIPKSVQSSNANLFIGQTTKTNAAPLFIKNQIAYQASPLFVYEIQPSSTVPLFTRSIDAASGINLIMNPQTSGVMPLNIRAPLPASEGMSLVWTEYQTNQGPLFIDGVFGFASGMSNYIDGVFGKTGSTTLTFSPGFSGVTPLTIGARFASGNMSLMTLPHDNTNQNISLYTRTPEENSASLYIINKTYYDSQDLFVNGLDSFTSSGDLFVEGSIGSGVTSRAPLFIGLDIDSDQQAPLFIRSLSGGEGEGGSSVYGDVTSFIVSGGLDYNKTGLSPLFMKSPSTGDTISSFDAFLKVDEPVIGVGGGVLTSGNSSLYIDGNNDAGIYYQNRSNAPLYLRALPIETQTAPLYIDRPDTDIIPLYINSAYESGNINVYISGNYTYNDNIGLFIKSPESNDFKFFLRGYLE